jgi:hypothetical protein
VVIMSDEEWGGEGDGRQRQEWERAQILSAHIDKHGVGDGEEIAAALSAGDDSRSSGWPRITPVEATKVRFWLAPRGLTIQETGDGEWRCVRIDDAWEDETTQPVEPEPMAKLMVGRRR